MLFGSPRLTRVCVRVVRRGCRGLVMVLVLVLSLRLAVGKGTLGVWTLMDYFGEPTVQQAHAWPVVSSAFGQFDIAGFPKAHSYWCVGTHARTKPHSNTASHSCTSPAICSRVEKPPVP